MMPAGFLKGWKVAGMLFPGLQFCPPLLYIIFFLTRHLYNVQIYLDLPSITILIKRVVNNLKLLWLLYHFKIARDRKFPLPQTTKPIHDWSRLQYCPTSLKLNAAILSHEDLEKQSQKQLNSWQIWFSGGTHPDPSSGEMSWAMKKDVWWLLKDFFWRNFSLLTVSFIESWYNNIS